MARRARPSDRSRQTDPFYLSPEWRAARARVLRRDPVCLECASAQASHVDHIKPRRLFPELALEVTNLRGLCAACHNTRSARQYAPSPAVGLNGEPLDPSHPWHAGEAARVVFRGRERAPQAWQLPVLRHASAGATDDRGSEQSPDPVVAVPGGRA